MAEKYSHLIQSLATTTPTSIYSTSSDDITIIKEVIICSTSTKDRTFSLAITKNGEALDKQHYIFYNKPISSGETIILNTSWFLDGDSDIYFSASAEGIVNINAFGVIVPGESDETRN